MGRHVDLPRLLGRVELERLLRLGLVAHPDRDLVALEGHRQLLGLFLRELLAVVLARHDLPAALELVLVPLGSVLRLIGGEE